MAKKKSRRETEKGEPPMSAMIDVVFLLLIFFIVTHKDEMIEAHMAINLPSAASKPSDAPKPKLIEIQVPPDEEMDGMYLLMGATPADIDTMEETLAGIAVLDPDQTIIIKVSKRAEQRKLIALLDRCKKVGLNQLNVLTLKM